MEQLSPCKPITILAVDDHPLFRDGIASVIDSEPDLKLVAQASNGLEAIASYREFHPDVTLMDIQMPEMNGIDATAEIRKEFPQARIVVLTTYEGDVHALRAIKAGAAGYLLKSMLRKQLLETVRVVHGGRRSIPPEIAMDLANRMGYETLSQREIEVLQLVATGRSNKRIGAHLDISEETVKVHMKSILTKMMANDRTHAVTLAIERGIIDMQWSGNRWCN
ncbi:response regulator [Undibacterium terreum]|uniref:DNA-binding response regulator n=1 Tax=Undibacterium terreum TaxID=1224302 RepID=A0A916UAS3_9BURK|nr:response regulator transcription factor [Undibacterium terreum]GGC66844.1 DNA-binding response regulator [Undibacterium terreum]